MTMISRHSELNDFVAKFCQMWRAGITANFHVEAHAGLAWCQVRAQLGRTPALKKDEERENIAFIITETLK